VWPGCVRRRFLTFICGRAGVCALGAVIAKHCDDQLRVTQYLSSFDEVRLLISIVLGLGVNLLLCVCNALLPRDCRTTDDTTGIHPNVVDSNCPL
jgi:hypothetical protein